MGEEREGHGNIGLIEKGVQRPGVAVKVGTLKYVEIAEGIEPNINSFHLLIALPLCSSLATFKDLLEL